MSPPQMTMAMENLLVGCYGRIAIIGHRGCGKNNLKSAAALGRAGPLSATAGASPSIMENTIASFTSAAIHGADFVEFDVQVTKDGHPIIFHDDFLCTSNASGAVLQQRIRDITLHEFLHTGFQRSVPESTRSPLLRRAADGSLSPWLLSIEDSLCTLAQAFAQVPLSVGFNIELKFDNLTAIADHELKRSIDAVLTVVGECNYQVGRRVLFSSFHPDAITLLRKQQSLYPALFLTEGIADKYPDARRNSIKAAIEVCLAGNLQGIVSEVDAILKQKEGAELIKAAGLALLTYGDLNNVAEVLHLQARLGVNGVIVDHVSEMVAEARQYTLTAAFQDHSSRSIQTLPK